MNQLFSYQDYQKTIGYGVTLLDFSTQWCAPCKSQEPILERLVQHYKGKSRQKNLNIYYCGSEDLINTHKRLFVLLMKSPFKPISLL